METSSPAEATATPQLRDRAEIPDRFKWNLGHIFQDWDAWQRTYEALDRKITEYAALEGTLALGPDKLLAALLLADEIGRLEYLVWYFATLKHDEDQRNNEINAKRQQVQILVAKGGQATAWFNPELLRIPLSTVRQWMAQNGDLAVYRFAIEELYRQQEHVLDAKGEHLLSLSSRFSSTPNDAYAALSTADVKHPTIRLSTGADVTVTYGQYRAILATNRSQSDRSLAFHALHELYAASVNTYASLYNSVLQRDWFHSQARGFGSALDAALHGNNIPTAVVDNLIETTKNNVEPLRRYHRLRKKVLGLETYHTYDTTIPLVHVDRRYPYNDTLDDVFTLAHEAGHSMHTLLSHEHQPFVYAGYTIFVAEVPSTLSEALFLEYMLARASDERERSVLLQHAIDGIVATFYTQDMFADYELQAHRLVEEGKPVTAEALGEIYFNLLKAYHGDAYDYDELSHVTWARIPHFFSTPYYVYQYATCFASSAQLMKQLTR